MKSNLNEFGDSGSLFGLGITNEESDFIVIPVPWEVTASYGAGSSKSPSKILEASLQVDLGDKAIDNPIKMSCSMLPVDTMIQRKNGEMLNLVREIGMSPETCLHLDQACLDMIDTIELAATHWLDQGKTVTILGGEHTCSLGLLSALDKRNSKFGILQIDAHADLRDSFQGLRYSHACTMARALEFESVKSIIQVGIRDYSPSELGVIKSIEKIKTHFWDDSSQLSIEGNDFSDWASSIIADLPDEVYISFDIDGLDPSLCPGTGTPVPGGFHFHEAKYLIREVAKSGRKIIGFDLCEIAGKEGSSWDFNVGARVLHYLLNYTAVSQGIMRWA